MSSTPPPSVSILAASLHARYPLKAWSLVITFFGDSVLPRGGRVSLSTVVAVLAELGVDAATVRAAVSRLTRDGWLVRERRGRTSDYRLDAIGLSTFSEASDRIYAADAPATVERWTLAFTALDAGIDRNLVRRQLRSAGFGALDNRVFLRPEPRLARPLPDCEGVSFFNSGNPTPVLPESQLSTTFNLPSIDLQYRQFTDDFSALDTPTPAVAGAKLVALRTLLVHEYRRVVLRDPQLPEALAPALAHRNPARRLARNLYRSWLSESERWLDSVYELWLEDPSSALRGRF